MSAAQHIEWLNLVEKTGPFLAVGVLDEAFPQGLEKVETRRRQRVRSAYDEWRDAVDSGDPQLDGLHREWVRLVLEELLEYEPSVLKLTSELPAALGYSEPQTGTEVRPDFAVLSGDEARLLIACYAPDTDLAAPVEGATWAASPIERMITLGRAVGVRIGLITDGEQWTLVSVPAEGGSSLGTWYARIWQQEPVTLQAFVSLLEVRRCFGPPDANLGSLFRQSLEHQDEVTDTLGEQVRRAVEVLVQALDRADLDRDRELLKDVTPAQLYEGGLTVMMRLVVLLCAEERKLLLLGEPIYDEHYAVSTLRSHLLKEKERLGEEVLERRHDAWSRLLAVFRAVFGGIEHETLRLPPLGGSLFDPDRFPFLEGRATGTRWRVVPAVPLPIDNRTVLMLLTALQVLEQRSGALLLSYEALDVEQIGHVYEGLLERTVKRVPETTLGLVGSSKAINPTVTLRELEDLEKKGDDELLAFLLEKTGRSEPALRNALARPIGGDLYHRLLLAGGSDIALADRIKPFALLLHTDSWGNLLAYRENAFIVTLGVGRRETGTHYTPKSLTEPIVQHTLEPLAYIGPAEGKLREDWLLRAPAELLALKVCDMAMGSGAFLVQTCRWLGERLVEAWDAEEKAGHTISVEGAVLDQASDAELMPRDQAERVLIARRLVANRCLYGVDINAMAVELAKLSIWLVTMMRNRPFNFLDHALKCGDSLVGVSQLKQLEHFSLRDPDEAEQLLEAANLSWLIAQAATLRRELEATPSHTATQIAEKARFHTEAETLLAKLRVASDFLTVAELECPGASGWETRRAIAASQMQSAWNADGTGLQQVARIQVEGHKPFHWPLEFPEVFQHGGFDAVVGNPPFRGGLMITRDFGLNYTTHLKAITSHAGTTTDLCAYFFRRAYQNIRPAGLFGLIATNSICEGDTRATALEPIVGDNGSIVRAIRSIPWPGAAALHVAAVHVFRGKWTGALELDGTTVTKITASLTSEQVLSSPKNLSHITPAFLGTTVYGRGFFLTPEEANDVISRNVKCAGVVKPFLNGDDVVSGPDPRPLRYVLNFQGMTEEAAQKFQPAFDIARERVFPERQKSGSKRRRERWWLYTSPAEDLYRAIQNLRCVFVTCFVSKYVVFERMETDMVFANTVIVVASDDFGCFSVLQSSFHDAWVREHSSTLETRQRYALSDCYETFPPPPIVQGLRTLGAEYNKLRRTCMSQHCAGLTVIYNKFHNPDETASNIVELRKLHHQLDTAVAAAYGWADLAANNGVTLRHDFHDTKLGVRWTLHPEVRRDILDRLLALNHQRYAEEAVAGLHNTKGRKKKLSALGANEAIPLLGLTEND